MQGIYSISGGYNSWRHWYQKHFGLLFREISLSRQTVVEHFDRSLPLVLVMQGGWAPRRRFSCSYIWSMCNSWFVFLGLLSQYLIYIAGSVQRLCGGLASCTGGLVLSFGSQAIDLRGRAEGEEKKDRTKSNWKVNYQPSYLCHISVRLNRTGGGNQQQSFTRQCKVGQCKISIIWQPVQ